MKSDIDIKDDVYKVILDSPLHLAITGELSKRKKPHNSKKEDIVISVLANETKQAQMAYVNVNVYVPDKSINGQLEEDTTRLRLLCQSALELFDTVRGKDFRISISDSNYECGQRVIEDTGTGSHIINNKLLYQIINE
ncbi:MAG: hypothetical protein IJ640_08510 [Prevotella sp.]|nr:hypothetical protein [Prevotella sp.]